MSHEEEDTRLRDILQALHRNGDGGPDELRLVYRGFTVNRAPMSDVHAAQLIKELLRIEDATGKTHVKTHGEKHGKKHALEYVLDAGICAIREAEANFEEHCIAGAAHINSPTNSTLGNSASTNSVPLCAAAQPPHHSPLHRQPSQPWPSSPLHNQHLPIPTPTKLPGYHYRQEPISGPRNAITGSGGSVGSGGVETKKSGCFPRWCFGPGKKKEAPSTSTNHELARAPLPAASDATNLHTNLPAKPAQPSVNPAALRHDRV